MGGRVDDWPSYPTYPEYPPSRERMLQERERRFVVTPLDDELSDLRYAPREVLIRVLRELVLEVQDAGSRGTYASILADYNLYDPERNERGAR